MKHLPTFLAEYLGNPSPVYQSAIAETLVNEFRSAPGRGIDHSDYTTACWLAGRPSVKFDEQYVLAQDGEKTSCLDREINSELIEFALCHGLALYTDYSSGFEGLLTSIRASFENLKGVPEAYYATLSLVWSFHVLKVDKPDYDISYSNPAIPFSIFTTVPSSSTLAADLRLAESILHEAMHLKLSLIEGTVDLIRPDSKTEFHYSPWQDSDRPLNGILHGLYVFRAIYEFLGEQLDRGTMSADDRLHCDTRRNEISHDLRSISSFSASAGLTEAGAGMADCLLRI